MAILKDESSNFLVVLLTSNVEGEGRERIAAQRWAEKRIAAVKLHRMLNRVDKAINAIVSLPKTEVFHIGGGSVKLFLPSE